MIWVNFLHFYQPPTQFAKIIKKIAEESYFPILKSLEMSKSKLVVNINASLTEQLAKQGLREIIERMRKLAENKQIEFTQSAAYHPLLPKLSEIEKIRQIKLNDLINKHYFGDIFRPKGFFPPEMAIDDKTIRVIDKLGFEWVLLDESAYSELDKKTIYRFGHNLKVFLRSSELSIKIAFAQTKTWQEFMRVISSASFSKASNSFLEDEGYFVTAMDGETFGHHRPEMLAFLKEAFQQSQLKMSLISDLPDSQFASKKITQISVSTWGVFGKSRNPFANWYRQGNEIQKMLWQLTNITVSLVSNSKYNQKRLFDKSLTSFLPITNDLSKKERQWIKARRLLDKALHSDQYWWASAKPRWHFQMIKRAINLWEEVIKNIPDLDKNKEKRALNLCQRIIKRSLTLHGDTVFESV